MHLSNSTVKKIAQDIYWARQRAQGHDDGEFYKVSGQEMPECLRSGVDEYSKGFRAGYYNSDDSEQDANA